MSIAYAQKNKNAVQTKRENSVSVLDSSAQGESLQRKADMANNATQRAEAPRPNNTGMPDNLKAGIESLSGFSMDNVRVHYNSSKPATVQALAYTQGTDIHVAPGQEKCLPHEAWHVAQQMAGRVSPTTNINGMPVNDNAALEHEADVMGEKAVQMKVDVSKTVQRAFIGNEVVQCDYSYDPSQNIIYGRPDETEIIEKKKEEAFKKDGMHVTAHHKYPWETIRNDIQNGFTAPSEESSLKTLDNLERFSGKKFPEPRASFLNSPNDRITSYNSRKKEYDTWIQNVCWTPGNIFLGPKPKDRLDDPKNSFDGHYNRSRAMTTRSKKLKSAFDNGGLSKNNVEIQENTVAPYVKEEWGQFDEYYYQNDENVRKIPFESCFRYEKKTKDGIGQLTDKYEYYITITVPKSVKISKIKYVLSGREQKEIEIEANPRSDKSDNKCDYSFIITTEQNFATNFRAFIKNESGSDEEVIVNLKCSTKAQKEICDKKLVELSWNWQPV